MGNAASRHIDHEKAPDIGNGVSQQIRPQSEDASDFEEGEPLQIIDIINEKVDGKNRSKLELKTENLAEVMLQPDVLDKPVVVVSVAGAPRKGKSFILGFFLKYLKTQVSSYRNI